MRIDIEKCVGCGQCVSYCPVGAIQLFKDEQIIKHQVDR